MSVADNGLVDIPKTFLTRRGALLLFSAPAKLPQEVAVSPQRLQRKKHRLQDVLDCSLKLQTLERLSVSVLQYGHKDYNKETASISDKHNPFVFKFLHDMDQERCTDLHAQPGRDVSFYLQDLKNKASSRKRGTFFYRTRSAELQSILQHLQQTLPHLHRKELTHADSFTSCKETSSSMLSINNARCMSDNKGPSSQNITTLLKSFNYLHKPLSTDDNKHMWKQLDDEAETLCSSNLLGSDSTQVPVKGERSYTPISSDTSIDPVSVLTEGACSLIEEEDVDILSDYLSDEIEEMQEESQWSGGKLEVSFRSRILKTSASEDTENGSIDVGTIQPLQPSYAALMMEDDGWISSDNTTYAENCSQNMPGGKVMKGSTATSPAMSRVLTPDQQDQVILMSYKDRCSCVDFLDETVTGVDTLVSLHRDQVIAEENMNERGNSSVGPDGLLITLENMAFTAPVETADETAPTLTLTAPVETADETSSFLTTLTAPFLTKLTAPVETAPTLTLTAAVEIADETVPTLTMAAPVDFTDETAPTLTILTAPVDSSDETGTNLMTDETILSQEYADQVNRRELNETRILPTETEEILQMQEISEVGEDGRKGEDVEQYKGHKNYQFSERVQKEKEEKEKKKYMLREDKQKAQAKKMEEEGNRRQQMEDKRKAAEERLKKLADEVVQRKIEQKKKQEEEEKSGIKAGASQNTPPGKKISSSHGQVMSKGGKSLDRKVKKMLLTSSDKQFVKVMDIPSFQADGAEKETGLESVVEPCETSATTNMPVDKSKDIVVFETHHTKIQPEKKQVVIPEHLKEILSRKSDLQTQEELEAEIGKMLSAVDGALGEGVLQAEVSEGLSAQDFILAQEALMERIKRAEEKIQEGSTKADTSSSRHTKLEKKVLKKRKRIDTARKRELAMEREAVKEQQRLEKQRRLEEVRQLQEKIILREEARRAQEADAKRKAEELAEIIESLRRDEEQIARTEADARAQVAAMRRAQRDEREIRRKIDLERKKQTAIEKRKKEKTMMEASRQKEQEMLHRISDAEITRRLREEEEAKREEEEMAAQERFEAEMVAAQRAAEDEEERFRDLERQAEEEAFQRLQEEKEAAEKQRWKLEQQCRIMQEEEERIKQEFLELEQKLKEEKRQKEEEEERCMEQERERLRELQRIEEAARKKMQAVLEQRRVWALRRREYNLNARANLDAVRQSQGFTDPWTFTYFVKWPRESYMRLMGQDPKKLKTAAFHRPQPQTSHPSANAEMSTTGASKFDVATVQS